MNGWKILPQKKTTTHEVMWAEKRMKKTHAGDSEHY